MGSHFYRSTFVCLGVGLLVLFTSCTKGTSISSQQATASPTTGVSTNSQAAPTASPARSQPMPVSTTSPALLQPAQAPTTPLAGPLKLSLSCSGPGGRDGFSATNAHARACVYTTPGAKLAITVNFCHGKPDPSSALQGSVIADASGFHEWSWTPQPDCKGQPIWGWSVTITAQLNGSSATISVASSSTGTSSSSSSSSSSSYSSSGS
jgi:hypothetical protein